MDPIPLWPGPAPGALGADPKDIPSITVFLPEAGKGTGGGMVIFPGGGYGGLSGAEGAGFAKWLAANGMVSLVVKYRLGSDGYKHPVMLEDAARAVRLARSRSAEWGIDPAKIGVMGSSAGGHLASTILTHFDTGNPGSSDPVDKESSRPDLGVLCYAVITMGKDTHGGSKANLIGAKAAPELVEYLSSEKQVTANTPPCFIWHTWEDPAVKVENSLMFAQALREKRVGFELHIYEKGGHGMNLGPGPHRWTQDCLAWLRERGFASEPITTAP